MTTKKFLATILTIALLLSSFATTTARADSYDEPYIASYSTKDGGHESKFYRYLSGGFAPDDTRQLNWKGNTLKLAQKELTSELLAGSTPAWAQKGDFLAWQQSGNVLRLLKYGNTDAKKALFVFNVISVILNNEEFVETIELSDGSKKSFAEILAMATTSSTPPTATPVATATPTATPVATVTPTATPVATVTPTATPVATVTPTATPVATVTPTATPVATVTPTATPVATVTPTATPVATATPVSSGLSVEISTDTAGCTIYKISNGHKVIVDGTSVYFDEYKNSDRCENGMRFVGITEDGFVYLYEDKQAFSFYQYDPENICFPRKIKFMEGIKLLKTITNSNNIMTSILVSLPNSSDTITYSVKDFAFDETWYPEKTYELNKFRYCEYFVADTNKKYILTLVGSDLYFGSNQELKVDSGITRVECSFGYAGDKIYWFKGSKSYWKPINNPTDKPHLWKQNVACLKYNSNGTVAGVKRLSIKQDWVKNGKSHKTAALYQDGSKNKTLKITKKGITLNGKLIIKLSKKQKKAKIKYTAVGFTEDGYIYVSTNKAKYKSSLSAPKKLKKWNISKVKYDTTLGFVSKG